MGGSSKPNIGIVAITMAKQVNKIDDFTREMQAGFIHENPEYADPSCRTILFMAEAWKRQSQIRDFISQMKNEIAKFSPLISDLISRAKKLDMTPRAQLTEFEVFKILNEFEALDVQIERRSESRRRQIHFAKERCLKMAERVYRQYSLMNDPDKYLVWKRIQDPELERYSILQFMIECNTVLVEAFRVGSEETEMRNRFHIGARRYRKRVCQYLKEVQAMRKKDLRMQLAAEKTLKKRCGN